MRQAFLRPYRRAHTDWQLFLRELERALWGDLAPRADSKEDRR